MIVCAMISHYVSHVVFVFSRTSSFHKFLSFECATFQNCVCTGARTGVSRIWACYCTSGVVQYLNLGSSGHHSFTFILYESLLYVVFSPHVLTDSEACYFTGLGPHSPRHSPQLVVRQPGVRRIQLATLSSSGVLMISRAYVDLTAV